MSILKRTWKHINQEGYVFISVRYLNKKKQWEDIPFKYPSQVELIPETIETLKKTHSDIYWCPLIFNTSKRRSENVLKANILWGDLDNVDPRNLEFKPTIYWQTSEKNFQAIWFLDHYIEPEKLQLINRNLSYLIKADKSGWDLTQVLRVPNTYNYKYMPPFLVTLVGSSDIEYSSQDIVFLQNFEIVPNQSQSIKTKQIPAGDNDKLTLLNLLNKYNIPEKIRNTLLDPPEKVVVGKRSDVLWYLEHELMKINIPTEDIQKMIKLSNWNKYRGRKDEDHRIITETTKVETEEQLKAKELELVTELKKGELPWKDTEQLLSTLLQGPEWLVKGIWLKDSHGIIAGEPKSFKSTIALDLAISIASGKNFLGNEEFKIEDTGGVFYIQNENSEWIMRDRTAKILAHKGIGGKISIQDKKTLIIEFPESLPLYFLNNSGFNFDDNFFRNELTKKIEELKPKLLIFDPLYLMTKGDLNQAKDLFPILSWLIQVKNQYKLSIILIHHWSKNRISIREGQKILGSTLLHGWLESALYLQADIPDIEEENTEKKEDFITPFPYSKVIISREFRAVGILPRISLKLTIGKPDELVYVPELKFLTEEKYSETEKMILEILEDYPSGISQRELVKELGTVSRPTLHKIVKIMISKGEIVRAGNKIKLPEDYDGGI